MKTQTKCEHGKKRNAERQDRIREGSAEEIKLLSKIKSRNQT